MASARKPRGAPPLDEERRGSIAMLPGARMLIFDGSVRMQKPSDAGCSFYDSLQDGLDQGYLTAVFHINSQGEYVPVKPAMLASIKAEELVWAAVRLEDIIEPWGINSMKDVKVCMHARGFAALTGNRPGAAESRGSREQGQQARGMHQCLISCRVCPLCSGSSACPGRHIRGHGR
jgi:hypothetical protein